MSLISFVSDFEIFHQRYILDQKKTKSDRNPDLLKIGSLWSITFISRKLISKFELDKKISKKIPIINTVWKLDKIDSKRVQFVFIVQLIYSHKSIISWLCIWKLRKETKIIFVFQKVLMNEFFKRNKW